MDHVELEGQFDKMVDSRKRCEGIWTDSKQVQGQEIMKEIIK